MSARTVLIADDDSELYAITSGGGVIRTAARQVRKAGRQTKGVRLMNLGEGDTLLFGGIGEYPRDGAGLVVGPCYLMRRDLVTRFPSDALVDDLHAACRAAEVGGRIALVSARVTELRAARGPVEFVRHKHRKARGYLREVRRRARASGQACAILARGP